MDTEAQASAANRRGRTDVKLIVCSPPWGLLCDHKDAGRARTIPGKRHVRGGKRPRRDETRHGYGEGAVSDACSARERARTQSGDAAQPGSGEGRNRTGDTTIFSRVLYQL